MTATISKGALKQLIRQSKWEEIGKLFGFTPRYHFGKIAPPAFFDWRCVPKAVYDILETPTPAPSKRIQLPKQRRDVSKTLRQRIKLHEEQYGICFYCRLPTPITHWTIEHRLPRSRGGTNDPQNKVGTCKRCNNAKGFLTEQEFLELKPEHVYNLNERCQRKMKQLLKTNRDLFLRGELAGSQ
jgi:hypothetical protein